MHFYREFILYETIGTVPLQISSWISDCGDANQLGVYKDKVRQQQFSIITPKT